MCWPVPVYRTVRTARLRPPSTLPPRSPLQPEPAPGKGPLVRQPLPPLGNQQAHRGPGGARPSLTWDRRGQSSHGRGRNHAIRRGGGKEAGNLGTLAGHPGRLLLSAGERGGEADQSVAVSTNINELEARIADASPLPVTTTYTTRPPTADRPFFSTLINKNYLFFPNPPSHFRPSVPVPTLLPPPWEFCPPSEPSSTP